MGPIKLLVEVPFAHAVSQGRTMYGEAAIAPYMERLIAEGYSGPLALPEART